MQNIIKRRSFEVFIFNHVHQNQMTKKYSPHLKITWINYYFKPTEKDKEHLRLVNTSYYRHHFILVTKRTFSLKRLEPTVCQRDDTAVGRCNKIGQLEREFTYAGNAMVWGQRYRRSINHRAGGDVELFLEVVTAPHRSARLFMQGASAHYFASHLSDAVVCRKFESRYLLLDLRAMSAPSPFRVARYTTIYYDWSWYCLLSSCLLKFEAGS